MARFAPNTHALAADQAIARLRNGLAALPSPQPGYGPSHEAAIDLWAAKGYRERRAYALATRRAQHGLRRIGGES